MGPSGSYSPFWSIGKEEIISFEAIVDHISHGFDLQIEALDTDS